jgi:DNA-directed RNA polymerase subunit RPC12/RpoP
MTKLKTTYAYNGTKCPNCGSEDITGEDFDYESNTRPVSCNSCNARWNETFQLTGFTDLELDQE